MCLFEDDFNQRRGRKGGARDVAVFPKASPHRPLRRPTFYPRICQQGFMGWWSFDRKGRNHAQGGWGREGALRRGCNTGSRQLQATPPGSHSRCRHCGQQRDLNDAMKSSPLPWQNYAAVYCAPQRFAARRRIPSRTHPPRPELIRGLDPVSRDKVSSLIRTRCKCFGVCRPARP